MCVEFLYMCVCAHMCVFDPELAPQLSGTRQKAFSIHCMSSVFPRRAWAQCEWARIAFSWHGCLFALWSSRLPACSKRLPLPFWHLWHTLQEERMREKKGEKKCLSVISCHSWFVELLFAMGYVRPFCLLLVFTSSSLSKLFMILDPPNVSNEVSLTFLTTLYNVMYLFFHLTRDTEALVLVVFCRAIFYQIFCCGLLIVLM